MRFGILMLVLALQGCVSWTKPGASAAQVAQDERECRYEAQKHAGGAVGTALGMRLYELRKACMEHRGYRYN